ncbi:MAG: hypothetical protein K0R71_2 [Bacillales bacterium]|nr:hypothetical protein [Bacillales bacterium]
MKKWVKFLFTGTLIAIFYIVFIREKFPLVKELPTVMQKQYDVVLINKRVILEKNGVEQSIGISIDKDRTVYIANCYGEDITKFSVDKDKKEIYIRKDLFNGHEGDFKFQLITLPFSKYKEISSDNKVNVYIDYGIGHELREYNLNNSEYIMLEYREPNK